MASGMRFMYLHLNPRREHMLDLFPEDGSLELHSNPNVWPVEASGRHQGSNFQKLGQLTFSANLHYKGDNRETLEPTTVVFHRSEFYHLNGYLSYNGYVYGYESGSRKQTLKDWCQLTYIGPTPVLEPPAIALATAPATAKETAPATFGSGVPTIPSSASRERSRSGTPSCSIPTSL